MVAPRDRRLTAYQKDKPRARWILHLQAVMWRFLMSIGMLLHKIAPPRPPKPNFSRTISSTISAKAGTIPLQFYVPKDYEKQRTRWADKPRPTVVAGEGVRLDDIEEASDGKGKAKRVNSFSQMSQALRRKSTTGRRWGGYPVVINFHGGGFTLGTATDDARWCSTVVNECQAMVISVDYRKAPEHPFPTAVEDGVDAVIYVHEHAEELGIDKEKIALSGFSSGGNMAFTVPLRLYDEMTGFERDEPSPWTMQDVGPAHTLHAQASTTDFSTSSDTTAVPPEGLNMQTVDTNQPLLASSSPTSAKLSKTNTSVHERSSPIPDVRICCIVPWYPSLDYTRSREERRATLVRKDHDLPALFTDLFDQSYLHPPDTIALDSPYLSPGVAPTALLKNALPQEIIMHTCEWDMLLDEGVAFKNRLESSELGKRVTYEMVPSVPHGWDKAPNPLHPTAGVREYYLQACKELRRVFGDVGVEERRLKNGGFSAAPRGSISVVR